VPPGYPGDLIRAGPGLARTFPWLTGGDIIACVTQLSVSVGAEDGAGGSRTVVRLVGEADVTTPVLGEVLSAEAAKKPRLLLVDVSGLTFIDSAALHEIVRAYRRLRADGGRLAIVSPSYAVDRILQLSALDQVIPVHASAEEADV
jgi:anti-anti-sigma factor